MHLGACAWMGRGQIEVWGYSVGMTTHPAVSELFPASFWKGNARRAATEHARQCGSEFYQIIEQFYQIFKAQYRTHEMH